MIGGSLFPGNDAETWNARGIAHAQAGRHAEALACFDHAVVLNPKHHQAHNNRGNALSDLGRLAEAQHAYRTATRLEPLYATAWWNLALACDAVSDQTSAADAYAAFVELRPNERNGWIGLVRAQMACRKAETVLGTLRQALLVHTDDPELRALEFTHLLNEQRPEAALRALDRLSAQDVNLSNGFAVRARLLLESGRAREAVNAAAAALESDPTNAALLYLKAMAHSHVGEHTHAIECYLQSINLSDQDPNVFFGLGNSLALCGRHEEALSVFDRADGCSDTDRLLFNRAISLLACGRYAEAWPIYEARKVVHRRDWLPRPAGVPELTTLEDARGRRVVVYPEQGLGDTIQFCRFLPLLTSIAETVVLEAPRSLSSLLRCLDQVTIIPAGHRLPEHDAQVALLSVPGLAKVTVDQIPSTTPYLSVAPDRVSKWSAAISGTEFKIAVAWKGGPSTEGDATRSYPLAALAPLAAIEGVRLISVQKHYGLEQLQTLPPGMAIETLSVDFDFEDTAAVMSLCDLVISCDSSPAHLAGALGRPVWLALRHSSEWRWMQDREDSPWYPTMRIFRQPLPGDWESVFARMAGELHEMLGKK